MLRICLPSGRELTYIRPRVENNKITYEGTNQVSRTWERLETYGGKLTENIVQAIARDCLAVAMIRLEQAGFLKLLCMYMMKLFLIVLMLV